MDKSDKEHVISWFTIALHDLESARKLATEPDPYLDTAIYHCQQAAEKAVKGFLVFHHRDFPKTHDIRKVVSLAETIEPGFAAWVSAAELLTPYATVFRYTDDVLEPSRDEFDQALQSAHDLYAFVLSLLPSETHPKH